MNGEPAFLVRVYGCVWLSLIDSLTKPGMMAHTCTISIEEMQGEEGQKFMIILGDTEAITGYMRP